MLLFPSAMLPFGLSIGEKTGRDKGKMQKARHLIPGGDDSGGTWLISGSYRYRVAGCHTENSGDTSLISGWHRIWRRSLSHHSQGLLDPGGELCEDELTAVVEVVFAAFVNDPQQIILGRRLVGKPGDTMPDSSMN